MITAKEVRKQRAQASKRIDRDVRAAEKRKLKELREHIKHAKKLQRVRLPQIRELCKRGRVLARERAKIARATIAAEAKIAKAAATQAARDEARRSCEARKHKAHELGADSVRRAQHLLESERSYQAELHRLAKPARLGPKAAGAGRRRAAELRAESDDEVRGNIPHELIPAFDKYKHKFKDTRTRTRTEAFAEWAAEHPAEVHRAVDAELDRSIAELIRAEASQRRAMQQPSRRRRQSLDERAAFAVPF